MTPLLSSLGQAEEKQKPVFSLTHHYTGVIPYSLQNLKVPIIAECQGPQARDITWARQVYPRQSIPALSPQHLCCTDHLSATNSAPLKL